VDAWRGSRERDIQEDMMGKKLEVVHGAKGDKEKTYHRRAKNKPLREIKKIIKKS